MPKKAASGSPKGPKKPRWTPAQKAAAKKKPHRGRGPAGSLASTSEGYAARPPRARDARDARDDRPAREDRAPRREWSPRPPRDDRPAREDRAPRREWAPRPARDDRSFRGDRPTRPARPAREGYVPRWDRTDPATGRPGRPSRPVDRDRGWDRPRDRDRERPVYRAEVADPEAARLEADTWVSSARRPVTTGSVQVTEDNGFLTLGIPTILVERLAREGITEPFPIQVATIPDLLAGRDVLGRGQTGSGKTLAFGLPTLARMIEERRHRNARKPHALVLVPTRELAMQVSDALEPLVHVAGLRHKLVAGGLSYTTQISALQRGVDLLIATPGRLIDLIERGAVDLSEVTTTILDEADHMAEMGFLPEVTTILDHIPDGGQRMLFSATLDHGVDTLVERYLTDPVTHSTDDATASVTTMRHFAFLIDPQHKKPITAELANRAGRTIVFVRTKLGADRVATQLREAGVLAAALHGGLSQGVRNRVLGGFRDGSLPVLVATDVAARGIHVDDVSLVLQIDPPADHKDYLHRSGRTARAGEDGSVVTLVLPHQRKPVERLLKAAGVDATPTRVAPGGDLVVAAGGSTPSGEPISEAALARLLEPPKAQRRFPRAARGVRPGDKGGYRPPFRRDA